MQPYARAVFRGLLIVSIGVMGFQFSEAGGSLPADTDTGNYLLRACKEMLREGPPDSAEEMLQSIAAGSHCAGYLMGMADMNSLYQGSLTSVLGPDRGLFCMPTSGIETDQTMRIVVKYLEANPEELHFSKRLLVVKALSKAFPCKGNDTPKPKIPSP